MTTNELEQALKQLESQHLKACNAVKVEFAMSNSVVRIGDIVRDRIDTIKVEDIEANISFKIPQCVYRGRRVKVNGEFHKSEEKRTVLQQNLKTD